jgi:hypothetical protein
MQKPFSNEKKNISFFFLSLFERKTVFWHVFCEDKDVFLKINLTSINLHRVPWSFVEPTIHSDERGIWEVAHVTEEDFETTEGEAVRRRIYMTNSWRWQGGRTQARWNRMTWLDSCLIKYVQRDRRFSNDKGRSFYKSWRPHNLSVTSSCSLVQNMFIVWERYLLYAWDIRPELEFEYSYHLLNVLITKEKEKIPKLIKNYLDFSTWRHSTDCVRLDRFAYRVLFDHLWWLSRDLTLITLSHIGCLSRPMDRPSTPMKFIINR